MDINTALYQFVRQHLTRLHGIMEEIGLYRGQPPVLHLLWNDDGQTPSQIAAALHLTPATVTRMTQRMEQAGLLERRPDPADQRVIRIYLSPTGKSIRGEVQRREQMVLDEMMAGFSAEEQAQLAGFFTRMRDNLSTANQNKHE
jgi:DNA-binding MarR family transcriptional regulator